MSRILSDIKNDEWHLKVYSEVIKLLKKHNYKCINKDKLTLKEGFSLSIDFKDKTYLIFNYYGGSSEFLAMRKHPIPISWVYMVVEHLMDNYPNKLDIAYILNSIAYAQLVDDQHSNKK